MQRRSRDLSIFSLSALDVLAMSTGVFVLLLVMLMPYYKREHDANAELEGIRAASAETIAEIQRIEQESIMLAGEADAAEAEAERLVAMASELEQEAQREPEAPESNIVEVVGGGNVDTPVIAELDLVFVVDTTASMQPVIRQVAVSLRSVVRILEKLVPSVRIGVVSYKDRDTGLAPIQTFPLTDAKTGLEQVSRFLNGMVASPIGSRTIQEDVLLGLEVATSMPLRRTARQALILVGDAAAHGHEQVPALNRARNFAVLDTKRTVSSLFTPTPSSMRRGNIARNFFQAVAMAGSGDFNDHAGSMIESILLSVLVPS